jgi:hypothetical protein
MAGSLISSVHSSARNAVCRHCNTGLATRFLPELPSKYAATIRLRRESGIAKMARCDRITGEGEVEAKSLAKLVKPAD